MKEVLPENVPVDIVKHHLSEEERICDECGTIMEEIGNEAEHTPVVNAKIESAVIPGSFASPEAIAHIMTQKFVMGSPLYRQE